MIYTNVTLAIENKRFEAKIANLVQRSKGVNLNWNEQDILGISLNAFQYCYLEMFLSMAECVIEDLERKQKERAIYEKTQLAQKRLNRRVNKEKILKKFRKKKDT